ncbi:MAG: HD domain-containing protein, partial [Bryobacteraceae bacterium]|nr:HD domain-containing protein [Bryobacteraceae bacterium]
MPDAFDLLIQGTGHAYFGEQVTQLEHALQSAYLAVQAGADDETILAALLHDIGHVLEG